MIVWYYHRVLPSRGSAAVSSDIFEKQISLLKKSGCTFVGTDGLREFMAGKSRRGLRPAMITFDDGWADNLFWATPILRKLGAKAVLAVNTGLVNAETVGVRKIEDYGIMPSKSALELAAGGRSLSSFLTWDELAEMRDSGVWEIQSHGNSHLGCYRSLSQLRGFFPEHRHWTMEYALGEPPFEGAPRAKFASTLSSPKTALSQELARKLRAAHSDKERFRICGTFENPVETVETQEQFETRLRQDLSECRRKLKDNLGIESDSLFWPWGQYCEAGVRIAKETGFSLLFTTRKAAVDKDTDPDSIPRVSAPEGMAKFRLRRMLFSGGLASSIRNLY